MILHWVNSDRLSANIIGREDSYALARLQQLIAKHHVQELQLWAFLRADDIRQKDRLETRAEQLLSEWLQVPVECIFLEETTQLEHTLIVVDRYMHWLVMHEPFMTMGLVLEETGILQQAVLIEGTKTFGERFISLYEEATQQYRMSPYQRSWLQVFQHFVHEFEYQSAYEMLAEANIPNTEQVLYLLRIQYARLNFNFEEALQYANKLTVKKDLTLLQTEMILKTLVTGDDQQKALAQITELYRHIKLMLSKEDWSSFLIRFYRAREAVLHYLMKYVAESDKIVRSSTIYDFIEALEDEYETGNAQQHYGAYFYTKSANVANTLNVRNRSLIGHDRQPIDVQHLLTGYYGAKAKSSQMPERFLADTHIMLTDLGSALDQNIEQMNVRIIEEMTKVVEVIYV